jgi:hypothetical protein
MSTVSDHPTAFEPSLDDWREYHEWCDAQDRQWLATLNQDWHATEPTPAEALTPPCSAQDDEIDPDSEVRMGLNPKADRAAVLMALSDRQARQGKVNRRYRRTHHGLFHGDLAEADARPRLDWLARQHASRRRWWVAVQKNVIAEARR